MGNWRSLFNPKIELFMEVSLGLGQGVVTRSLARYVGGKKYAIP